MKLNFYAQLHFMSFGP